MIGRAKFILQWILMATMNWTWLSSEEAAKLLRLARIAERASQTFESDELALDWLRTPNHALAEQLPLDLLDTSLGAEMVMDTLGRIEHGVFV